MQNTSPKVSLRVMANWRDITQPLLDELANNFIETEPQARDLYKAVRMKADGLTAMGVDTPASQRLSHCLDELLYDLAPLERFYRQIDEDDYENEDELYQDMEERDALRERIHYNLAQPAVDALKQFAEEQQLPAPKAIDHQLTPM